MGSFSECTPKIEEEKIRTKKVRFNSEPTTIVDPQPNPDGSLVFHMVYKDFEANVKEKFALYSDSSTERLFLNEIAFVIRSNYLMYHKLDRYLNGLSSYDTHLDQIYKRDKNYPLGSLFPDTKTFDKLAYGKESFKQKLNLLLSWLEPSYKLNENLLQIMNDMDANTKIDSKLYNEMVDETVKVKQINETFKKVFDNFPMEMYRDNLGIIQQLTAHLHLGKPNLNLEIANEYLDQTVPSVDRVCPKMKKSLKRALRIDFEDLYAATVNFHGIVMEALKVDEGGPSKSDRSGE